MDAFFEAVKYNCDVSDARYWGSFSICGFLMRVRDLYRSEMNIDPWDRIPQSEISAWLDRREVTWRELETADYMSVRVDSCFYDRFDIEGINAEIGPQGLVYGAGLGLYGKPTFFVADVLSMTVEMGHTVYVAGREHVRDIFSSAGMSRGGVIVLRLSPLKSLLWEKVTETRSKTGSRLHNVLSRRHLLTDPAEDREFRGRLEKLAESYGRIIVAHELAESLEDVAGWSDLVLAVNDRGGEYFLRAAKDLLADTSDFGPLRAMIEDRDVESLEIFSELFGSYHRRLSPELERAVKRFLDDGSWEGLDLERLKAHRRFRSMRDALLETFRSTEDREESTRRVRELICRYATPEK